MLNPQDFRFPYEDWRTGKTRPEPIVQDDPRWLRWLIRAAEIAATFIFFVLLPVCAVVYWRLI